MNKVDAIKLLRRYVESRSDIWETSPEGRDYKEQFNEAIAVLVGDIDEAVATLAENTTECVINLKDDSYEKVVLGWPNDLKMCREIVESGVPEDSFGPVLRIKDGKIVEIIGWITSTWQLDGSQQYIYPYDLYRPDSDSGE